jgi:hypothetical protein
MQDRAYSTFVILLVYGTIIKHGHLQIGNPTPYLTSVCRPHSTNTMYRGARPHHISKRIPNSEFLLNYISPQRWNQRPVKAITDSGSGHKNTA